MVQIYNKRDKKTPVGTMYCGRPSIYGNPFEIGVDGSRDEVCNKFEVWLDIGLDFGCKAATAHRRKILLDNLHMLIDQDLECWCSPKRCHCTTLAKFAQRLKERKTCSLPHSPHSPSS